MAIKVCTQAMLAIQLDWTAYLGFLGIKQLGVLLPTLSTPNGMPVYPKITPQALHQATLTYCQYPFILLGGEKHCEKKAFFSQEHNTSTQPGLAPRLFDPKSSHSLNPKH